MASVARVKEGDLVLSQTKCYGVVLYYLPEADHYIVLWTIIKDGDKRWRFNQQLRARESFEKI